MSYFAWKFASNTIKQNKPQLSQKNGTNSNKTKEIQNLKDDMNLEDIMKLL